MLNFNQFYQRTLVLLIGVLGIASCEKGLSSSENDKDLKPIPFNKTYFSNLGEPLNSDLVYRDGMVLTRNSVMQGFDLDESGNMYLIQVAGFDEHNLNLCMFNKHEGVKAGEMTFSYFGHGTNISLEEDNGKVYVWVGSHGYKASDGSYTGSLTVSRIEYKDGVKYEHSGEDVYIYEGVRNIHPAVNREKNIFAVTHSKRVSGVSRRTFSVYKLDEVLALEKREVTLPSRKYGGGKAPISETTSSDKVQAKVISDLKPLYEVKLSEGFAGDEDIPDQIEGAVGKYAFQGFDADENFIYFFEGVGNENDPSLKSAAFLSVIGKNGVLSARKEVAAANDVEKLKELGFADNGYFEAEGVKIIGDELYLGFASRKKQGSIDQRLANILKYTK